VNKHAFNNSRVKLLQLFETHVKLLKYDRMGNCRLDFEVVESFDLDVSDHESKTHHPRRNSEFVKLILHISANCAAAQELFYFTSSKY